MAGISGWITRGQLVHGAARTVATLRAGGSPWSWTLRGRSDLVASRVFGNATLAAVPNGIAITSRDGTPFELGLPLTAPIDLAHSPWLRIDLRGDREGTLGLRYQSLASGSACSAEQVTSVPSSGMPAPIDLSAVAWHTPHGEACPPPAVVAYMLRLQISMPAGATLTARSVTADPRLPVSMPPVIDTRTADIQWPGGVDAAKWAPDPLQQARYGAPVVRLPEGASAESMLQLRDRIRQFWPAAIILPFGQALPERATNGMPAWLDWGICSLYAGWLMWLALRQRAGVIRPWTEVAAIAFGPLWLIAGLRWGPEPSIPGITAFVAALLYGGQSEWRRRPLEWSWWGRSRSDWLYPLLPLPIAAALTLADGHHLLHLEARHILAYLGWALLQQWAMLALVMGRLERTGLPKAAVILITATLFGLLHTPNGSLMQLCLLAELWWAWSFMRSPRLIPIALAHASTALLVEAGLTGHLLRSLEVSARFFL